MMEHSAEKDTPPVDALADLIDQWWQNADQPTMRHDGVEYVASLALARFLVANGCSVIPPAEKCGVCGATRDEPEKCGYPGGCPIPTGEVCVCGRSRPVGGRCVCGCVATPIPPDAHHPRCTGQHETIMGETACILSPEKEEGS